MPLEAKMEFTIDLKPGTEPMEREPCRMSTPELMESKVKLKELLNLGHIHPSVFPWISHVNFIQEKYGA